MSPQAKKRAKPQPTRSYRGSATVVIQIELDLGEAEQKSGPAAKRYFEELAHAYLAGAGKLELVRHSSHYGVDLSEVSVKRIEKRGA